MSNKKPEATEWPEGFEPVDLSYEALDAWDWDKKPMCQGIVVAKGTKRVNRGGRKEEVDFVTVQVGDDRFNIWEAAQLMPWIDNTFEGQEFAIMYQGKESIGNDKSRRTFEVRTRN